MEVEEPGSVEKSIIFVFDFKENKYILFICARYTRIRVLNIWSKFSYFHGITSKQDTSVKNYEGCPVSVLICAATQIYKAWAPFVLIRLWKTKQSKSTKRYLIDAYPPT